MTSLNNRNSIFQLLNTRNDLPIYYSNKERKPNIKESQIMNKNKLYQSKIRSHFDSTVTNYITEEAVKQKFFFEHVKEGVFYQTLLQTLNVSKPIAEDIYDQEG